MSEPDKTSVPQVHPIEDLKWRIASLLERGLEIYRATGDILVVDQATKLARELYESELKLAGNKRTMDWPYINRCGAAIEKVEEIVRKRETTHKEN